jgi:hypothetical protein
VECHSARGGGRSCRRLSAPAPGQRPEGGTQQPKPEPQQHQPHPCKPCKKCHAKPICCGKWRGGVAKEGGAGPSKPWVRGEETGHLLLTQLSLVTPGFGKKLPRCHLPMWRVA